MSAPKDADDVKLVASLFSPEEKILEEVTLKLQAAYGPTDWVSPNAILTTIDNVTYYVHAVEISND